MQEETFDTIVIGSGIGGLTVASLLAQLRQRRVLVLERHFRLGGFTHAFTRPGGYSWDVGLHYVGEMAPGAQARSLMDLVTGGRIDWAPIPAPFETFSYPGLEFAVPVGKTAYREALAVRFPAERAAIDQYFRDVKRSTRWMTHHIVAPAVPWLVGVAQRLGAGPDSLALSTTRAYLDAHFRAPELKAVLASQWGDYGLPPGESAFCVHAMIASHYFDGAWYPVGGAGGIAEAARRTIEAAGGACLTGHTVTGISLRDGRAVGVRVTTRRGEREFFAPTIVSDAGAVSTFERMLPPTLALPFRDSLRTLPGGHGVATAYLGLKASPATLGLTGGNRWLYTGFDHDALFARRAELLDGRPTSAYLSFPSLKDPHARAHTAEIITSLDFETVSAWKGQPWRNRDVEYQALKARILDGLLDLVETRHPGFRDLVAFAEVSTPLSVEHFTGHRQGDIYGIPATPERFRQKWLTPRTPVPGLLLTGSDAAMLGIVGAMMGGVATTAVLLGAMGFPEILRRASRKAPVVEPDAALA